MAAMKRNAKTGALEFHPSETQVLLTADLWNDDLWSPPQLTTLPSEETVILERIRDEAE